jgi:hypothetical protein
MSVTGTGKQWNLLFKVLTKGGSSKATRSKKNSRLKLAGFTDTEIRTAQACLNGTINNLNEVVSKPVQIYYNNIWIKVGRSEQIDDYESVDEEEDSINKLQDPETNDLDIRLRNTQIDSKSKSQLVGVLHDVASVNNNSKNLLIVLKKTLPHLDKLLEINFILNVESEDLINLISDIKQLS